MKDNNNNLAKEIGQKIKFMRNTRHISSSDLAKELNITRQQLQKYEIGEVDIKVDRLYEIANLLGVDISFFFSDSAKTSDNSTDKNFDILANFNHIKDTQIKKSLCGLIKELSEN